MSDLDQNDIVVEDIEAIDEKTTEVSLPKDEKAAVDSVDKASQNGSAKKRRGDQAGRDEPEGSKDKSFKNKMYNEDAEVDFSAEFNALTESEATLSESFREKAATIFEAAITMKLDEEVTRLEEQYSEQLAEAVEEMSVDLSEKVNSYLNYVVESWMEENEVAIEATLRSEIAENFMAGLKDLFVESYIEVPESKVDLVDSLADQVAELEEQLNAALEDKIELSESLVIANKAAILAEAQEGLTIQQAERLVKLAEGVEASTVESFAKKVNIIKEAYFAKKDVVIAEDIEDGAADSDQEILAESHEGPMAQYLAAISRLNKK